MQGQGQLHSKVSAATKRRARSVALFCAAVGSTRMKPAVAGAPGCYVQSCAGLFHFGGTQGTACVAQLPLREHCQ